MRYCMDYSKINKADLIILVKKIYEDNNIEDADIYFTKIKETNEFIDNIKEKILLIPTFLDKENVKHEFEYKKEILNMVKDFDISSVNSNILTKNEKISILNIIYENVNGLNCYKTDPVDIYNAEFFKEWDVLPILEKIRASPIIKYKDNNIKILKNIKG